VSYLIPCAYSVYNKWLREGPESKPYGDVM
jgi:hypothetical protein